MAENIEIKAKASDFERQHALARNLSGSGGVAISQRDVFFHVPKGRLKLRVLSRDRGELIAYERSDSTKPRRSVYYIEETLTPGALETVLAAALDIRGVVTKRRTLYLVGQARIHLDEVDGLGRFIEIEVVLGPGRSRAVGERLSSELMKKLEIHSGDVIAQAYIDLLAPGDPP